MRRIIITNTIVDISKSYAKNLFKGRRVNFKLPQKNLKDLESYLRSNSKISFADYVRNIIDKYYTVNCIKPEYFKLLHQRYFNKITENDLKTKINYNDNNIELYKHIVNAMRYDAVRENEFLPYIRQLGIKTCVYCNTQFAITTENIRGKLSGKYELDHFLPKSKYPFLCTSFFNLQLSCSHCNKSKNDKESLFRLYTSNEKELSPFSFRIGNKSVVKYMLSKNCEDLEIIFDSADKPLKDDHEEKFHITELYSTLKDIAEEIVWKSEIYNDSYKKSLLDSFSNLFSKATDFNRFILGNYDQPDLVHKRPLAKLVQDIAKQLELID